MSFVKKNIIKSSLLCLVFWGVNAQQYLSPEYIKVTNERASKIVAKLALLNPEKEQKVTLIIAQQFRNLTKIQDERDAEIEKIKNSGVSKEQQTTQLNQIKEKADQSINELHTTYVKQLATATSTAAHAEEKEVKTQSH